MTQAVPASIDEVESLLASQGDVSGRALSTVVFLALSVWAYDPSRGIQQRKALAPAAG